MQLPDGTVLMHGSAPYDPQKAHEYYLRYRKLHPRAKGAQEPNKGSFTVKETNGKTVHISAQKLQEQKAYAAHRVAAINEKLTKLKAELKKRVEEAEVRARDSNKPKTAAEKAKAARKSKLYRESHRQQLANKAKTAASKTPAAKATPAKSKTTSIVDLKVEIMDTKASLKAAVAKQRELATARRNG